VFAVTAGIFTQPSGNATGPALQHAQVAVVSTSPSSNQGLIVTFYQVNQDLSMSAVGSPYTVPVGPGALPTPPTIAAAAGRFNGGNHDQLAIAYPVFPTSGSQYGTVEVTTVDFNAQGVPSAATLSLTGYLHPEYLRRALPLPCTWLKALSTGQAASINLRSHWAPMASRWKPIPMAPLLLAS